MGAAPRCGVQPTLTYSSMSTSVATLSEIARELEGSALDHPDERGEILIEAAHQWRHAGDTDRATKLLEGVLALGGLDAQYAAYGLAEIYFDQGTDDLGYAHLEALKASGPTDPGPAGLVAELLEERGEHAAAQAWFDIAIGLLDDDERARLGRRGFPSLNANLLFGRRRCREHVGMPADDLDRLARIQEENRLDFVDKLERSARSRASVPIQMLIWQREQQLMAAERWPDVFTAATLGHHSHVEQRLRTMSGSSASTIFLVLGDAEEFASYLDKTGGDASDEQARLAYSELAFDQGRHLAWPPGRNSPCWCGSGQKYKKCCGAP